MISKFYDPRRLQKHSSDRTETFLPKGTKEGARRGSGPAGLHITTLSAASRVPTSDDTSGLLKPRHLLRFPHTAPYVLAFALSPLSLLSCPIRHVVIPDPDPGLQLPIRNGYVLPPLRPGVPARADSVSLCPAWWRNDT